MSATDNKTPTVEELRREIDAIDREIQTLLERRADVVVAIGGAKKSGGAALPGSAMRPGREAQILRRVVAAHKGALPVSVLTGLWRGIVSAYLRMQYPFTVHVATGQGASARAGFSLWDLARVHFGPATPLEACNSPAEVIARVAGDSHAVGVVAEKGDWWAQLPPAAIGSPQVVALLPFVDLGQDQPAAYVIACADREESGEDITLVRLRGADQALFTQIAGALGAEIIATQPSGGLLAAPGYLTLASPALAAAQTMAAAQGAALDIIGGYAAPIRLKDDALAI